MNRKQINAHAQACAAANNIQLQHKDTSQGASHTVRNLQELRSKLQAEIAFLAGPLPLFNCLKNLLVAPSICEITNCDVKFHANISPNDPYGQPIYGSFVQLTDLFDDWAVIRRVSGANSGGATALRNLV